MELSIGKMSNKELSDWFGIKETSFRNKKKERLEELKNYAEFYEEKGKVVITKIIDPVYVKKSDKVYKDIVENMDSVWNKNGLDSCARVGAELYNNFVVKDPKFPYEESTIITYTRKGRNELYGKPYGDHGTIGSCQYVWCKRDKETGNYDFLTEEEEKVKKELQTKYFGDATEKQIMVNAMYEAGEIDEKEAFLLLREWTNMSDRGHFMGFLGELQKALGGVQVIRGTLVDRGSYFELEMREEDGV